jgi:hypothetical protein
MAPGDCSRGSVRRKVTTTDPIRLAAWPPDVPLFTLSASRLEKMGGKYGDPTEGCERKYTGEYLYDMRQSGSAATERGSALHYMAEVYQATGEVISPESELASIFQAGMHMLNACGRLLVEHEHIGMLPDGTPFVAYLDGHSPHGGDTYCIVVQDIKTTSDPKWALTPDTLPRNVQSMLYAWILMCLPHWYCPTLPDGHMGPKHWQWWDPVERGAKATRLRWLYFLTRGTPRAWEVTSFVYPADAHVYMEETILPLAEKMSAAHEWRLANPTESISEVDRNLGACSGRGRFCGVHEKLACEFGELGTPLLQLRAGQKRPQLTAQERLAALKKTNPASKPAVPAPTTTKETPMSSVAEQAKARLAALAARRAGATPIAASAPVEAAPATENAQPDPKEEETTAAVELAVIEPEPMNEQQSATGVAVSEAPVTEEPKRRGRPKGSRNAPPSAPPGAGINPPEVSVALAAIAVDPLAGSKGAAPAPLPSLLQDAARDPILVARTLAALLPVGISMTVTGVGK